MYRIPETSPDHQCLRPDNRFRPRPPEAQERRLSFSLRVTCARGGRPERTGDCGGEYQCRDAYADRSRVRIQHHSDAVRAYERSRAGRCVAPLGLSEPRASDHEPAGRTRDISPIGRSTPLTSKWESATDIPVGTHTSRIGRSTGPRHAHHTCSHTTTPARPCESVSGLPHKMSAFEDLLRRSHRSMQE